ERSEVECSQRDRYRTSLRGTSESILAADGSPDAHRKPCDAFWRSWPAPWEQGRDVFTTDCIIQCNSGTNEWVHSICRILASPRSVPDSPPHSFEAASPACTALAARRAQGLATPTTPTAKRPPALPAGADFKSSAFS